MKRKINRNQKSILFDQIQLKIQNELNRIQKPLIRKTTVKLSNLSPHATQADIKYVLKQFGEIDTVVIKGVGGVFNGQVMVTFKNVDDGRRCIEALNGAIADGRTLVAQEVESLKIQGCYMDRLA